jgi:proteasome accessory factor C
MRLTRAELAALDLGLGLLALERPMEEQGTIAAARERVRGVAVAPPRVVRQGTVAAPLEEPELPVAVEPAPDDQLEVFGRLCQARDERRAVRLTYARAEDTSHEQRVVHPWAIVRAHQHLYIVAWCTTVTAVRVFRLDRVREVVLDGASFDIPDGFDVAELQHDGRLFAGQLPDDVLVVRYAPRIARWIAEREGVALDDDGSVTVSWPLADEGWAVRHVLQYGVDAEVRSPAHIRQALVARLEAMASSMPPPG